MRDVRTLESRNSRASASVRSGKSASREAQTRMEGTLKEAAMVLVLFRSKLTAQASEDYKAMADKMLARARNMSDFIGFKTFGADDGERLSVPRWESRKIPCACGPRMCST